MIIGGCLCGAVRYEYSGEITEIALCHCLQCRQAQGTPFVTNAPIDANKFVITKGQSSLNRFYSSPGKERVFCAHCASPIYSAKEELPNIKRLRVGTVETHFTCNNQYHIFVGDKASWYTITDNFPQYKAFKL